MEITYWNSFRWCCPLICTVAAQSFNINMSHQTDDKVKQNSVWLSGYKMSSRLTADVLELNWFLKYWCCNKIRECIFKQIIPICISWHKQGYNMQLKLFGNLNAMVTNNNLLLPVEQWTCSAVINYKSIHVVHLGLE